MEKGGEVKIPKPQTRSHRQKGAYVTKSPGTSRSTEPGKAFRSLNKQAGLGLRDEADPNDLMTQPGEIRIKRKASEPEKDTPAYEELSS